MVYREVRIKMFESRAGALVSHILREGDFELSSRQVVSEELDLFQEVDRMIEVVDYPTDYDGVNFRELGDGILDNLREAIRSGSDDLLLHWVRDTSTALTRHVSSLNDAQKLDDASSRGIASRTSSLAQQASSLLDQSALRASAKRLTEELQESVEKAKDATGTLGNASLSSHFATYADKEVGSANRFRAAALAGFTVALAFALVFGNGKDGWLLTFQSDWTALAFKITGAAGIGGISAYLARQSGQHRRMANWARSMAVQLQSFPAFIDPLDHEEQAEMYRMLARRVLTAPPEKQGGASEDTVGAVQLLDLFASLAKRAGGQTPPSP